MKGVNPDLHTSENAMRRLVLLAALFTAAPALASDDCPPEQEESVFQLDSIRLLWNRLHALVRTGSLSNGLDLVHNSGRQSTKTPYNAVPTRDAECGPATRTPVGDTLDHIYE